MIGEMAAVATPPLVEGQPARLDVGASLPCRVIGFSGRDVVLALDAPPPEAVAEGGEGYLLLESDGRLQAVRGHLAAPAGGEVVFRLTDAITLGQRRMFSRAPLAFSANLRSADGRTWSSVTRDVSAGGVRVARRDIDPGAEKRLELTIVVVEGRHEVKAKVEIVRLTATDIGLRFADISREDRLLLAALAIAYHRRS